MNRIAVSIQGRRTKSEKVSCVPMTNLKLPGKLRLHPRSSKGATACVAINSDIGLWNRKRPPEQRRYLGDCSSRWACARVAVHTVFPVLGRCRWEE